MFDFHNVPAFYHLEIKLYIPVVNTDLIHLYVQQKRTGSLTDPVSIPLRTCNRDMQHDGTLEQWQILLQIIVMYQIRFNCQWDTVIATWLPYIGMCRFQKTKSSLRPPAYCKSRPLESIYWTYYNVFFYAHGGRIFPEKSTSPILCVCTGSVSIDQRSKLTARLLCSNEARVLRWVIAASIYRADRRIKQESPPVCSR